ncbi:MAG: right-handed parallel beta-helix repeat-containing protein [Rikenellaceae bacterium]
MNRLRVLVAVAFTLLCSSLVASEVIKFSPSGEDFTPTLRKALESTESKDVKLVFEEGEYFFTPEFATQKYCVVTNHGNGLKNIIFPIEGYNSIEIEGNGSKFIFHGQVLPFLFEECAKVTVKNLSVDWDIPFLFQAEMVAFNKKEGWRDVRPYTDGFSWSVKGGVLTFPNVDGFAYTKLGSSLAFDKEEKRVASYVRDFSSSPRWVEEREGGILRIHEPMKVFPPIGTIVNSKGDRNLQRYAPAFEVKESQNVTLEGVTVHHALGMAYLFERSSDIKIINSNVMLPKGSDRVVSSTADATHFANCKGDILIEGCRFENMLDDGTNVHGTYVEVSEILSENTLRIKLVHNEQCGFEFAGAGDEVWFIKSPNPNRAEVAKVKSAKIVNEIYSDITFDGALPEDLKVGDILENKTWNPTFTMRGCTIRNHRARNIVLKTPLKTVIEENFFSSHMSAILFRGETYFWYESGAVEDVLIKGNHFKFCAYSGADHAALYITPRLGEGFDQTAAYDRNIRFEDNTIENFVSRVVWADRVEGLSITRNKITHNNSTKPLFPNAPLFDLDNCRDVEIMNNNYEGSQTNWIEADDLSRKTLKVKNNKGFNLK